MQTLKKKESKNTKLLKVKAFECVPCNLGNKTI